MEATDVKNLRGGRELMIMMVVLNVSPLTITAMLVANGVVPKWTRKASMYYC